MNEDCLDTNVCIAIINGSSVPVRARLKAVLTEGSVVCVSSVVLHELWYGVAKSTQQESNTERVRAFLSGPFEILPWDDEDASTLVTASTQEFKRVDELMWEDWALSKGSSRV